VRQHLFDARGRAHVIRYGLDVVGAHSDVGGYVAIAFRATVALVVEGPGVVAELGKMIHRRHAWATRHLQVEAGYRAHRRAMHEKDRAARCLDIGGGLAPDEQAYVPVWRWLAGPVLLADDLRGRIPIRNDRHRALLRQIAV